MTEPGTEFHSEIGAPVCFRHQDRETYIRCSRCERPICPDCMVSAPVGFHCPECVRAARSSVREARTVAGGKLVDRPTATYAILVVCVVAFGLEMLTGTDSAINRFGMIGGEVAINGQWYRLVTSAFLHVNILHIAMNMYVLYIIAPVIERFLGHARFLILYVLAGLGGSVASFAFSSPNTASVGASGAIFGLMGALLIMARRTHANISQAMSLIGLNLVFGFLVPGIDWRAHLGGLFVGFAVAAIFGYAPRRNRVAVQAAGVIVIVALLAGIVSWRSATLNNEYSRSGQLASGGLPGVSAPQ